MLKTIHIVMNIIQNINTFFCKEGKLICIGVFIGHPQTRILCQTSTY